MSETNLRKLSGEELALDLDGCAAHADSEGWTATAQRLREAARRLRGPETLGKASFPKFAPSGVVLTESAFKPRLPAVTVDEMREREHCEIKDAPDDSQGWCRRCTQRWPCDAAKLLDERDELVRANAPARRSAKRCAGDWIP